MKTKRSRSPVISQSRWTAYATAGAATALVGANTADATIHYVSVNESFNAAPGTTIKDTFFLGSSSNALFVLQNRVHANNTGHAEFVMAGAVSAMFAGSSNASATNYRYPFRLGSGVTVNNQTPFIPNFSNSGLYFATLASHLGGGNFKNGGIGFIGVRFDGGNGQQYGWIRLNMTATGNSSSPFGFTLIDYAWGDVGDTVVTGQVPEPGSLGLLALGGVGLLVWRQRRQKQASV
jgi:hypothetical protein